MNTLESARYEDAAPSRCAFCGDPAEHYARVNGKTESVCEHHYDVFGPDELDRSEDD